MSTEVQEVPGVPTTTRRGFKLIPVSKVPSLLTDGLIPGLDCPGEIIGDQFYPEGELGEEYEGVPWYIVNSMDDVDRLVADVAARYVHLGSQIDRLKAEKNRLENRASEIANRYVEFVPAPPAGGTRKMTKGGVSGCNYTNQPVRKPSYELADKQIARDAGLLREVPVVELRAATVGMLEDYIAQKGQEPPGYIKEIKPPVSVTFPKQD